ncbi:hypothetical protein RvY_04318 [Ramazzottius varieornatus]|uniref:rhomboid protease n=1 Tax=Ramazzottius varieornatus TaxID=947166 RepID=A0A1D1UR88_RAMVA|nr:hypothetical protein RvY_04318 [Ramazzottius varieornatus]
MTVLSRISAPPRQSILLCICRPVRSAPKTSSKLLVKSPTSPTNIWTTNTGKFIRATAFCSAVAGTSYLVCAIWNYENFRKKIHTFPGAEFLPMQKLYSWQEKISRYWKDLNDGKKVVIGLVLVNCVIFLLWQLRSLQPFMRKYFLSNPTSNIVGIPLLASMFSHIAPFHLFCNMYVLWSFSDAALHMFGREQFLYFYMSAGLFAGLVSLSNKFLRGMHQPSLGASGAIIGALGAVCTAFPDSKLSIIFLPMYTFSAGSALNVLLAFEALGVALRWSFFDHAAHLGGLLFGIWYVKYGHELTWAKRKKVLEWWHQLRGHTKK